MPTMYAAGTFPSDTTAFTTTAGAVTLSQTAYRTSRRIPLHAHRDTSYVLLLRGRLIERVGGAAHQCQESAVIVRPPEAEHENVFLSESLCCNLEISAGFYEMWPGLESPKKARIIQGGPAVWTLRRLRDELVLMDDCSALSIQALAVDLVISATRSMKADSHLPRWLTTAKELMRAEMRSSLVVEDIARQVGVHPVHLSRTYKVHFGTTIQHDLRQMRVRAACEFLRGTDAPLADVARSCGFFDQSHFTRCFKLFVGYTPKRYRQRFASDISAKT